MDLLQVVACRPATSEDRTRASSSTCSRSGGVQLLQTMKGLRQAMSLYREAAEGWRAAGDVVRSRDARSSGRDDLPLHAVPWRLGGCTRAAGGTLSPDGGAGGGGLQLALPCDPGLQSGPAGARQAGARPRAEGALAWNLRVTTARIRRHLGYIEFELGNFEQARALAQNTQSCHRHPGPCGRRDGHLDPLTSTRAGRQSRSCSRALLRSLDLARGDPASTGLITMWLGSLHIRRGELDEAAARFEARLAQARNVQRDQEAVTRLGLGDVMLARGDRQGARKRYESAAAALERAHSSPSYRGAAPRSMNLEMVAWTRRTRDSRRCSALR